MKTLYYICTTIMSMALIAFAAMEPALLVVAIPMALFMFFLPTIDAKIKNKKINCIIKGICKDIYIYMQ